MAISKAGKPKYSTIQNTWFTIHGIWEYDRPLFLLLAVWTSKI